MSQGGSIGGGGGGGGGDVVGPASSTTGSFAVFADTTGKLLAERASPLDVQYGGTGNDIFAIGSILIGEFTSALSSLSPGDAGSIVRSNGAGLDPSYTNASYPPTAATGDLIYAIGLNAFDNLTVGSTGQVLTVTAGIPAWVSPAPGAGSWVDVAGTTQALAINTGYIADNAGLVTFTLPATAVQFSIIEIVGHGAGGWIIAQNAGQQIIFGNTATTVGVTGSLASTNANDCVKFIAVVGGASTIWTVQSSVGNLTVV